jgi:hypothetical protein
MDSEVPRNIRSLMNTESLIAELTPHLQTAEKAVAVVTDPRLREIAFGRVLDLLIYGGNADAALASRGKAPRPNTREPNIKKTSEGVRSWLEEMVSDEFFSEPKSVKQMLEELSSRSHYLTGSSLTQPLENLCHDKVLRRRKQAPVGGGKEVFHWAKW